MPPTKRRSAGAGPGGEARTERSSTNRTARVAAVGRRESDLASDAGANWGRFVLSIRESARSTFDPVEPAGFGCVRVP